MCKNATRKPCGRRFLDAQLRTPSIGRECHESLSPSSKRNDEESSDQLDWNERLNVSNLAIFRCKRPAGTGSTTPLSEKGDHSGLSPDKSDSDIKGF
jgi:hypothetical protein